MESDDEPKALAPPQNGLVATPNKALAPPQTASWRPPIGAAIRPGDRRAEARRRRRRQGRPALTPISSPRSRTTTRAPPISRACLSFFAWCETKGIADLVEVEPFHVGAYLKAIGGTHEKPTVKQHLAAIRMLFDWLVVGQVVAINPGARGARSEARRQARQDAGADRRPRRASCSTASTSRPSSACATAR